MQTLEYRGSEVFLCNIQAPSEAKVSLTENINVHACGSELGGLYISHAIESVLSFSVLSLVKNSICGDDIGLGNGLFHALFFHGKYT